jgi:hypothetical protein
MALCWLILAGSLLIWQRLGLSAPSPPIWGTGIPLAWFILAMALYNLLRWWLDRSTKRRACKELYGARRHVVENPNDAKPRARVDPDFDFGPGLPKSR